MDLSKLSTEDLLQIQKHVAPPSVTGPMKALENPDLSTLSDAELIAVKKNLEPEPLGFLDKLESWTGAPTRAGLVAGIKGGPIAGLKAYGAQFGVSPRVAPTSGDVGRALGISSTPLISADVAESAKASPDLQDDVAQMALNVGRDTTRADVVGGVLENIADPSNIVIPKILGLSEKVAGKTIVPVAKSVASGFKARNSAEIVERLSNNITKSIQDSLKAGHSIEDAAQHAAKTVSNNENISETLTKSIEESMAAGKDVQTATKIGMDTIQPLLPESSLVGGAVNETGKIIQTTGRVLAETTKNTAQSVAGMVQPKQSKNWPKFYKIAEKHGFNLDDLPASVEFSKTSKISDADRVFAEGPLGEEELLKFERSYNEVQSGLDQHIKSMASGKPLDPVSAGDVIKEGYNNAIGRVINDESITHSKVIRDNPGLMVNLEDKAAVASKMSTVEKWAKGQMLRGWDNVEQAQASSLLKAIDAYRRSKGSYKQTYEFLDRARKFAYPDQAVMSRMTPPDVEKFRDIYHTVRESLINTVRKDVSPEMAMELINNNKAIAELNKKQDVVKRVVGATNGASEKIFETLVLNGNTEQIKALRHFLSPEDFGQVKASFLENLIKREPDGSFSIPTLYNKIDKRQSILGELFTKDELQNTMELLELGKEFGNPILNTSKTSVSGRLLDLKSRVAEPVMRAWYENQKRVARSAPGALNPPSRSNLTPPTRKAP